MATALDSIPKRGTKTQMNVPPEGGGGGGKCTTICSLLVL